MYQLNFAKRVWIVKQRLKGISPSKIALAQNVSEGMIRRLMRMYKLFGWDGLKDHKTGRPETVLNPKIIPLIFDQRRYGYGACHIEEIFRKKKLTISHRQIEKVLLRNGLVKPNIKKQKSRKWVRYELPNPNDMWHTDWSYDPFTGKQLSIYIDDRTRLITSYGVFKQATSEHSVALLKSGIAEYGKPKSIMTDHGSQYYANHPEAVQEHTQFRIALDILGIKHYLARVNRPQTNGKAERFFLTYKTEYIQEIFTDINDFIKHYNKIRLHSSLNYKTPHQIWKELTKRN